jgi:hypothetical protein
MYVCMHVCMYVCTNVCIVFLTLPSFGYIVYFSFGISKYLLQKLPITWNGFGCDYEV